MKPKRAAQLAALLDVDLGSRGVCLLCLSMVSMELEHGDGRVIAGSITTIAPGLWSDGLGEVVRTAVERKVAVGVPNAADALHDLDDRGFRSTIFRAVVRRLAEELEEEVRREYLASLN